MGHCKGVPAPEGAETALAPTLGGVDKTVANRAAMSDSKGSDSSLAAFSRWGGVEYGENQRAGLFEMHPVSLRWFSP